MSAPHTRDYLEGFERLAARRGASEPDWLRRLRGEAIERFAESGFPTTKLEEWKYTSVRRIAQTEFRGAGSEGRGFSRADVTRSLGGDPGGGILAFVNGRFARELSSTAKLPEGAVVLSLAAALAKRPAHLEPHLARLAAFGEPERAFVALNTAFLTDGALVILPRGSVLGAPIGLVFLAASNGSPVVSHPRVLIVAEPGSRATIVESYAGAGAAPYLTNAVTEVVVGADARIDHVKLQCESDAAFHVSTVQALQERDSRFTSCAISFGAALARNDVNSRSADVGAEATLNGLFVAAAGQHVDNHTEIDHAKPHGKSSELYKGILGGSANGVFDGKIVVRPDAQRTNARQTNMNLLVSKDAAINTKPQLEIYADDVKCTHGSTIGHLDELALFYLRSRGIAAHEARQLLTRAFASEVTGAIGWAPLRARVEELLSAQFGQSAPSELA